MKSGRFFGMLFSCATAAVGFLTSCVSANFVREPEPPLQPAWALYRKGNFAGAKAAAVPLLESKETEDAGHYLLCLVSHMTGEYPQAIAHYSLIRRSYPKRKLLVEPVAWSYIHLGDYEGALRHLETSGIRQEQALLAALAFWQDHPLQTEAAGVIEIPFTEDRLSPFMPGFRVRINGHDVVARLDTGGAFIHLSPAWAERLGVRSTGREKSFASLMDVEIGYGGFADLEFGSFSLRNVPVYVMDHLTAQSEGIAAACGEELGPIIGTNVFQQFLVTIDGPGKRFILSPRGDATAAAAHAARLAGEATEVPFAMWSDHFMIARGRLGEVPLNLFVDSGLVMANAEQGQAALLAPVPALESWGAAVPEEGRFAVLPCVLGLGEAEGNDLPVFPVPEATWKAMGDWGGVDVDALLSWGFLKDFAWTLDFDRRVYVFRKPAGTGDR
ncbi:MAG: hypothetical protein BWK76_16100 [Desulfobulbaceae bacterium A2]|nr:MAG: hypothetical protein BWK76_16100 [Desulfobulbaceae bacterium A2]